jgi:hypothetical protein
MAILMIAAPAEKAIRLGHSNLLRSLIIPSLALTGLELTMLG